MNASTTGILTNVYCTVNLGSPHASITMREAEALNGFNQLGRAENTGISTPCMAPLLRLARDYVSKYSTKVIFESRLPI